MKDARRLGLVGWIVRRRAIERLICELDALARHRLEAGSTPRQSADTLLHPLDVVACAYHPAGSQ